MVILRAIWPGYLLEVRVLVPVRGRAAAQEPQPLAASGDLMPGARRDQDRIAGRDLTAVAVDLHLAPAVCQVVDLLRFGVVVALRGLARLESRLGEALVLHRRGRDPEQLADRA